MIRLFTIHELEQLSIPQLEALRAILHRLLALTDADTAERRNILASLENADRVWIRQHALPALSP